ncbi:MAG: MATE family efflux transporter [Blautia sp.]|nr:MATE family efflux transporter [Blautia sp.]MDY3999390.1 MATE family efflux transporter [Blautia sp.]
MRDMTKGSAHSHLWRYALPLLLGNWLQLAYNAVDSIIAGRFIGKNALAAEGIASPVMNLVILAITGLCIGAGVLMSEYFGGKEFTLLRQSMATMLLSGSAVSVAAAALCMIFTPDILKVMAVPEEIYDITVIYLRITFLGMPFTFIYNALAAGLKSVGDSKTPLKFLAFSAVLNAVLACGYMLLKVKELWPRKGQWKIDRMMLKRIMNYGGSTAFQQAVQPVGKVLIQGQVNALGVSTIAAFNAVTRVDDFACIPEQGIASAISTYIAQNKGAKKYDRIRTGFRAGIRLEICYWLIIGSITALFRTPMISMFVTGEGAKEVVNLGSRYLMYMCVFYLWPALTNGFQGFFRGMGKMYTTIIGTTIQISVRTVCTYLLAPELGMEGIAFACVTGWSLMLMFEIPYYFVTCRKMPEEIKSRKDERQKKRKQ